MRECKLKASFHLSHGARTKDTRWEQNGAAVEPIGGGGFSPPLWLPVRSPATEAVQLMEFNEAEREGICPGDQWRAQGWHRLRQHGSPLCWALTWEVSMVLVRKHCLMSIPMGFLQLLLVCASDGGCSGMPKGPVAVLT